MSHPLFILIPMWSLRRKRTPEHGVEAGWPGPAPSDMASAASGHERACEHCLASLAHCHGTLVLHADGTLACDEASSCELEAGWHQWWVSCTELEPACGCTGDEHPLVELLARAA